MQEIASIIQIASSSFTRLLGSPAQPRATPNVVAPFYHIPLLAHTKAAV